jgi:hypothetical protein
MQEESAAVKGSQKKEEYSKRGRTREQYIALRELDSLTVVFSNKTYLLFNFKLSVILSTLK